MATSQLPRPQIFVTGEVESVSRCWPCQTITGSWRLQLGPSWQSHGGVAQGELPFSQTYYRTAVFNSPINLNLSFSSPETWPRLFVELHSVRRLGGSSSLGEVLLLLPNTPGRHRLVARLCRDKKQGSWNEKLLTDTSTVEQTVEIHVNVEIVFSHLRSNSVATGRINADSLDS